MATTTLQLTVASLLGAESAWCISWDEDRYAYRCSHTSLREVLKTVELLPIAVMSSTTRINIIHRDMKQPRLVVECSPITLVVISIVLALLVLQRKVVNGGIMDRGIFGEVLVS